MPLTCVAFSPCQITGFFRVHDDFEDTSRIGSTGAGVNLEQGVTTRVFLDEALRTSITIFLNGTPLRKPVVSKAVLGEYLDTYGGAWQVQVFHECPLPVGTGYGTSGAGAASLSLAINEAMGNSFSREEALRVAHRAEVDCRTGLGTVASVSKGGFNIRVTPGAPGVGEVRKIPLSRMLRVVSGSFGPIPTSKLLSNRRFRKRVNLCGRRLLDRLLRQPDETNFLRLSRSFADCSGLLTPRLSELLGSLEEGGVLASMMMIGDGAFCIVPQDTASSVCGMMKRAGLKTFVSEIRNKGAQPL